METRLIDVREYPEFAEGHIENSELVPLGTLPGRAKAGIAVRPYCWFAAADGVRKMPGKP